MNCERRVICGPERLFYRTTDINLTHIGISGIVVDIETVSGLQDGIAVSIEIDADILHLVGVGQITAENVGNREYAGLETIRIFDSLRNSHTVVHSESTGERSTDLPVDGDSLHITEGCQVEDSHGIAGFESEIGISIDTRPWNGEHLHSFIRASTFHINILGTRGVPGLGILEQRRETLILFEIIVTSVVDVSADRNILVQRLVACADAHGVTLLQHDLALAGQDILKVIFKIFLGTVLETFYLNEIGMSIGCEASCIVYKVEHRFSLYELVAHRAIYGTFYLDYLLGDRDKDYIPILDIIFDSRGRVGHIFVEVQTIVLACTGKLYIADGSHLSRASCRCEGIESCIQSADGEASLNTAFTVYAHGNGAGSCNGNRNLVRTEREELAEFILDCSAALGKSHSLEKNLGGSCRLDGTVCSYPLVDLGLRGAENGDMHFITFAKHVSVRSLGAIGSAEDFEILAREQGMAIYVIAGCWRNIILDQSLFQGSLRGDFAHCALRRIRSGLHHAGRSCRLIGGC